MATSGLTRVRGPMLYLLGLIVSVGLTYFWLSLNFFAPFSPSSTEEVPFLVERGWNLKTVCIELENQKFVRNWWAAWFLARLKGDKLVQNGRSKIQAGEYRLSRNLKPIQILQKFIDQDIVYHDLLLKEGATVKDVIDRMAQTTLVTRAEATSTLSNQALMSQLGIPTSSFEGFLFPETYRFTRPDNAEMMVTRMTEEMQKRVISNPTYNKRAGDLGMPMKDILILASIIENETGNAEERKLIASVFHNRLRLNMPLQSDPTVIYGIPNFNGNLTRENLLTPSSYNTYLNRGLPPTPICNPGIASIEAALYPADTDFIYFVSKGDGTSHFSSTYKEHREMVKKYQVAPAAAAAAATAAAPVVAATPDAPPWEDAK